MRLTTLIRRACQNDAYAVSMCGGHEVDIDYPRHHLGIRIYRTGARFRYAVRRDVRLDLCTKIRTVLECAKLLDLNEVN